MNISDHKTYFSNKENAVDIARQNNFDDPDWTYTVIQNGKYFHIAVIDENNETIGYL